MNTNPNDFISREPRLFRYRIGRVIASSLSGLIAGMIIASMLWYIGIWYTSQLQSISYPSAATILTASTPVSVTATPQTRN
jgi:hypothetical protein